MAESSKTTECSVLTLSGAAWESELFSFRDLRLLRKCIQCGTCSGSCSVAPLADYTPRMIVNLVARGDVESALRSRMIFLCTNCLACSTRCPRGIPVADLMMKLRNLSIANHLSSTENEAASREFVRNVLKRGRVYEPELMIRLAMKTSPSSLLNMRDIAIALLRKGKLNLPSKSQTDLRELRRKFKEGE